MAPRSPKPGTVLVGKYRVVSLIGEGGMGVVIKARHIDLDEDVAIKYLRPEMMARPDIVQRFLREAKAAVKLKGEHVARVIDVGRLDNDIPYIVMEYLEGADLNAILKAHGAQEPHVAVDLILQACEAIAEAHSIGIIHRDIKASNFFVTQAADEAPVLKVLDFGIATAPEGASELTSTQSVIGTPSYMAPEQMRSSKIVDARSDIWSMGVVLYELLEGARPFRSEVYSDLCLKVGMDPPEPITNPEIPDALRAVVFKCLEKPMEHRYQSIAELAFDLMEFASDPVTARATVEQCARILGRRSTRMFEAAVARGAGDTTPVPRMPSRITPTSHVAQRPSSETSDATPAPRTPSGSARPSLLGQPTPAPTGRPGTPTSIQVSSGEVTPAVLKPERRGVLIALTATTLVVIGGIAMFALDRGHDGEVAPAATPTPAPVPIVLEPATATQPDPETRPDPPPGGAKTDAPKVAAPEADAPKAGALKVDAPKPRPTTQPRPVVKRVIPRKVVKREEVKKPPPPKDPVKKDPVKKVEPGGELFEQRE